MAPQQIATLERFLRAGFRFVTFERYSRYIAVEKDGFVALLDPAGGTFALFGQAGYVMGDGIGMLVERPEGKVFLHHSQSLAATAELLVAYAEFKREVAALLSPKE